jgi:5-(carboxyamino)imidazole ribonucleotide synthase
MKTLGIIGGGQLGRMICFYAQMMGLRTVVFTDQKDSPASFVTNQTIVGDYLDKIALKKFCDAIDFATFEFENIPLETAEFVAQNSQLYPNVETLKITQNRILEKNFLNENQIKTAEYKVINNFDDLKKGLEIFKKAILKTAIMGYDGKGQFVLEDIESAQKIYENVKNYPLILEKFCRFDDEVSVIVARSKSGEIKTYDPLTNVHKNGILQRSFYPSKLSLPQKIKTIKTATKIAEKLDLVGIMAVEFFIVDNKILVNELAPRPHNSGHFSMNASITSQFEQLIRAITGMALGDTRFHSQGQMINLIGAEVNDIEKYQNNPRAKIHLYGKGEAKEGRKMGHVNILK